MTRAMLPLLGFLLLLTRAHAAGLDNSQETAKSLAARLSTAQMGAAYVRLMMVVKDHAGGPGSSLQLQIKERRTSAGTDVIYQVLWPKERKGESVLLHQENGGAPSGWLYVPPNTSRQLSPGQMAEPLFGGNLACQDAVENCFGWENQALAGTEAVNRINCAILDSKPGDADHTIYGRVRSWIDPKRYVPMRIEKYLPSGRLARRIETVRVANDDQGHPIPADLVVRAANSETDLNGSKIRHDVSYTDEGFTPAALKDLSVPHPGAP